MTFPAIKTAHSSIFFNMNGENIYLNTGYKFILISILTGFYSGASI